MPLIIGVLAVVVFVVLVGWLQDQKQSGRNRQLNQQATALGLSYSEEPGPRLLEQTHRFLLFAQGRTGSAHNVMAGTRPVPGLDKHEVAIDIFEYAFSVPFGRYTESWRQTVMRLTDATLDLPSFSLIPEPVFDTMVANARDPELRERLAGIAGISFRDHPDFSERMHLLGPERTKVRALFSDDLIAAFGDQTDLCFEGSGPYLIFYRFEKRVSAKQISGFLDAGWRMYATIRAGRQDNEQTTA